MLASQQYCHHRSDNAASQMKITFTPMHGVGAEWTGKAFAAFSLREFVAVPQQNAPDPDFPTVAFPNPEEGKVRAHTQARACVRCVLMCRVR
jgi:phosphoglucomutase/phosphopentomutase